MRFRSSYSCLVVLLSLILLLAACGPVDPNFGPNNTNTPTTEGTHTTQTPTPQQSPVDTATDVCPGNLSQRLNCYTPHSLRVAYGVESLFQQGFSGKGQTVVVIDSFGSPTLQQDVDVFDRQFGLPPITIQVIAPLNESTYDPRNDRPGWAGDTT